MTSVSREGLRGLSFICNKRVLAVASTGGHLAQLSQWSERLGWDEGSTFVTFKSAQSQSLLAGKRQVFVPYVRPRGILRLIYASLVLATFRRRDFDVIVSSGAGLALAVLPAAFIHRLPFVYIESVSRIEGPSLTGRILERFPRVERLAQHPGYRVDKWTQVPSLIEAYSQDRLIRDSPSRLRVFVTLGTISPYRFDRLVDAVLASLTEDDEVRWQVGETSGRQLPGDTRQFVSAQEFDDSLSWADVVVSHAGVGTLLKCLQIGKLPVVMARTAANSEHVDDHQSQIANRLANLGLARLLKEVGGRDTLLDAASRRVTPARDGLVAE